MASLLRGSAADLVRLALALDRVDGPGLQALDIATAKIFDLSETINVGIKDISTDFLNRDEKFMPDFLKHKAIRCG